MSISNSITNILNLETQKLYLEDVITLQQNYTKFQYLTSLSTKLMEGSQFSKKTSDNLEFKQILEISSESKIEEINAANKNLAQFNIELYSNVDSFIKNTNSFYTLINELKLDTESATKSGLVIQILVKLSQLNKKIISGKDLSEKNVRDEITDFVKVLRRNLITLEDSSEDNETYSFLKLYQEKTSQGKVLYLNEIPNIDKIKDSKIGDRLILQIRKK